MDVMSVIICLRENDICNPELFMNEFVNVV